MGRSDLRGKLNFEDSDRDFFIRAQFSSYFLLNHGQHRASVTRPSTPLCRTYSESPGCEDSPGGIQNIPYL